MKETGTRKETKKNEKKGTLLLEKEKKKNKLE